MYIYEIGFHKYMMTDLKGLNWVLKDKDIGSVWIELIFAETEN